MASSSLPSHVSVSDLKAIQDEELEGEDIFIKF
jgi:hypothetical protein